MPALPQTGALTDFLTALAANGAPVVRIAGAGPMTDCLRLVEHDAAGDPRVGAHLRAWHADAADDLAGPPLAFDEAAARWGAAILFRAAWCHLHRDTPAEELTYLLAVPLPVPLSPAAMFSADLALRRLPDIHRLAAARAPSDPLLASLQSLAFAHPLSTVALPPPLGATRTAEAAAWRTLRAHAGLWHLFLDRVIAAPAPWWLADDLVRQAVRTRLGPHAASLAPALSFPPVPA